MFNLDYKSVAVGILLYWLWVRFIGARLTGR